MIRKARMFVAVAAVPGVPCLAAALKSRMGVEAANFVATGIPTAALAVLEYGSHRAKSSEDRVAEAVDDDVFRNPILVALYLVLAIQAFQGLVGFFVGLGMGIALEPYDVEEIDAANAAGVVLVPMMCIFLVYAAKTAAHRIKAHRFEWLALAIALTCLVNIVSFTLLWDQAGGLNLGLIVVVVMLYGLYLGAVALGVMLANRGQGLYRLGRAYRAMKSEDRRALIELALGELPERAQRPATQVVRIPHRPDTVGVAPRES